MRSAAPVLIVMVATVGAAAVWPAPAPGSATSAALATARNLRIQGCGGHSGIGVALRDSGALNAAALQWSRGANLKSAVEQSGYREEQSAAVHVNGDAAAVQQAMTSKLCAELTDRSFIDLGSVQRGNDTWIIIAAPFAPPARANANEIAGELLQRINRARAQPRRCGDKTFSPAPPLHSSVLLRRAAERFGAPSSVLVARKKGFNVPIARMLRDVLAPLGDLWLDRNPDILSPYLAAGAVRKLWREHLHRQANDAFAIWPILILAEWLGSARSVSHQTP